MEPPDIQTTPLHRVENPPNPTGIHPNRVGSVMLAPDQEVSWSIVYTTEGNYANGYTIQDKVVQPPNSEPT